VLTGKSKTKIVHAIASALDKKELPALEPGTMCYMMSKQQYLSDHDISWHPQLIRATRRKPGVVICPARRSWPRMTLKNGRPFSVSGWRDGAMGRRLRRLTSLAARSSYTGLADIKLALGFIGPSVLRLFDVLSPSGPFPRIL
jgi:hypothetical protein